MSEKSIQAPFPGVFYHRPDPDSPPFVEVGQEVQPDTVVGIMEVMKMFHELQSGVSGTIAAFAADNEQSVSAGEDLVILE
jgi:acetyl-CoA carboxylase biotin carboxyl carrier protein